MELRHAVQFASRTAPSRLWASSSSECRRAFSTTRQACASNPRALDDVMEALAKSPRSNTSRSATGEVPSNLPPRPPAAKSSWERLSPSTPKPAAPSSSARDDAYLADMAMLPEVMTWDINDFSANNSKKGKSAPLEMRNLRPSTGRTIEKWGTIDVARAFQVLDFACRKNNVAKDFRRQRFHERPGLKRKRLRSERWRALFKEGFRATCARVEVLRRQGW